MARPTDLGQLQEYIIGYCHNHPTRVIGKNATEKAASGFFSYPKVMPGTRTASHHNHRIGPFGTRLRIGREIVAVGAFSASRSVSRAPDAVGHAAFHATRFCAIELLRRLYAGSDRWPCHKGSITQARVRRRNPRDYKCSRELHIPPPGIRLAWPASDTAEQGQHSCRRRRERRRPQRM